jgi:hypothetical protein
MSSSLYDTFGNQTKYDVIGDTLVAYLEDATIKFPLPEATSQQLATLLDPKERNYDSTKAAMILSKLVKLGFSKANATALTPVLMKVAQVQKVDPLEFFSVNTNTLNLALDAYKAINNLRPVGSRVGLIAPLNNSKSRVANLIKP